MSERAEWNTKVIEEFRANKGVVGGPFEGIPLLLLHHVGAKSGTERVSPLAYRRDGDAVVIFGSAGGQPKHPSWFHNVAANSTVSAEIGEDEAKYEARVAEGDERDRLWTLQKTEYPGFASYEAATTRQIPVVVLDPAP